jgi:type IV pilus assembly protein PilB
MRANTLPTVWWEKLVMRIVDKSKKTPPLEELWLEWWNKVLIMKHLAYPNGIILNTWPTWSGKTTTLYACLDHINTPDINIVTYEDPVENKMEWLNQAQVRSDIWFTFASGLRWWLRQDPDVIMVWEIRDKETLDMAMESAMTWHLVFSTVHTNSAIETISRVLNLWAQPYMIAWTFNLVIAQRLARKCCSKCLHEIDVSWDIRWQHAKKTFVNFDKELLKKEIISRWISKQQWTKFISEWKILKWSWKTDTWDVCPYCWWTWYKWRVWLFELMDYTDEIKNMLMEWKSNMEVEQYALQHWMIDLERDGIFKVIEWQTDLDEIYRYVKVKYS